MTTQASTSNFLTVAAVQMEMRREETLDEFRDHVADIVRQARDLGAELVLLPELSTSGLLATHPRVDQLAASEVGQAWRDVFPGLTEAVVETFASIAIEYGVWLAGGSHWRRADDGTYRNTAYLAHPDGRIDSQDKLHLTWPEQDLGTTAGQEVFLFEVRNVKVAIQTCADVEFAEVTRALVTAGADVVLCPSLTWNSRGASRVAASCLARSVEQQVFVVQSPMIGTSDIPHGAAMFCKGRARITVPIDRSFGVNDGIAAVAESTAEEIVVATLDIEKVRQTRLDSDSIGVRHARPDLYRGLTVEVVGVAAAS